MASKKKRKVTKQELETACAEVRAGLRNMRKVAEMVAVGLTHAEQAFAPATVAHLKQNVTTGVRDHLKQIIDDLFPETRDERKQRVDGFAD